MAGDMQAHTMLFEVLVEHHRVAMAPRDPIDAFHDYDIDGAAAIAASRPANPSRAAMVLPNDDGR